MRRDNLGLTQPHVAGDIRHILAVIGGRDFDGFDGALHTRGARRGLARRDPRGKMFSCGHPWDSADHQRAGCGHDLCDTC